MKKKAFSLLELSVVILIIAILIAGIVRSVSLIEKFRISSAKQLTESSGINSMNKLELWVDSISENSVFNESNSTEIADGEKITTWVDVNNSQVISTLSLNQTSSSNRPTYAKNSINNLPVIRFDGANDYLEVENIFTKSFDAFVVLKTSEAGASEFAYDGDPVIWADAQTNGLDIIPIAISDSKLQYFNGSPDSNLSSSSAVSDDKAHIVNVVRGFNDGLRKIYIDGALDASDSNGAAGKVLNDVSNVLIGGNLIDSLFFNGDIAEIIVFSRILQDYEREAINEYLSKKWKVEL